MNNNTIDQEQQTIQQILCIGLAMSPSKLYVDSNGNGAAYVLNGKLCDYETMMTEAEKKLRREQRKLGRSVPGSNNNRKLKAKVLDLQERKRRIQYDFLHQVTSRLADKYDIVAIEKVNMSATEMPSIRGEEVPDSGWSHFVSLLKKKVRTRGTLLVRVNKPYLDSKRCENCGTPFDGVKSTPRTFECPNCGRIVDADKNDAVAVLNEALQQLSAGNALTTLASRNGG